MNVVHFEIDIKINGIMHMIISTHFSLSKQHDVWAVWIELKEEGRQ